MLAAFGWMLLALIAPELIAYSVVRYKMDDGMYSAQNFANILLL